MVMENLSDTNSDVKDNISFVAEGLLVFFLVSSKVSVGEGWKGPTKRAPTSGFCMTVDYGLLHSGLR